MPRKTTLKYLVEDKTDGVTRWYFRTKGQPKVRIGGKPFSPEFMEHYHRCLAGDAKSEAKGPRLAVKGTLRWLCEQYFGSAEYKHLADKTRRVRRQILESCWAEKTKPDSNKIFEEMPISAFGPKSVRVLRDRKADLPEAANGRVKALRQVFSWAVLPDVELALTNPARDIPYFRTGSDGFHSWSVEDVEKFEARHPIGTNARLAMALLLYTGQRRSDIVLFGRQHVRKGWLRFTQQKNRNNKPITLEIPILPVLQSIIDATSCGDLTFLINDLGNAFTANGFGNKMRDWCDQAELPDCTSHGLRKAAAARLADNGATEHQIMAITGHQTSKEVTRYTKAARQKVLARSASNLMAAPAPSEDDE